MHAGWELLSQVTLSKAFSFHVRIVQAVSSGGGDGLE